MSKSAIKTPTQENSNTVLFEMMMYYKRKMEIAEETAERDRKRLKLATAAAREAQDQLHEARVNIRILEDANRRGSAIIMQKNHAGMLMADAFDGVMGTIAMAVQGDSLNRRNNVDVKFINEQAQTHQVIFDVAMTRFTTGWLAPDDDVQLETDEVIDLTEEETEEEDVGEWV